MRLAICQQSIWHRDWNLSSPLLPLFNITPSVSRTFRQITGIVLGFLAIGLLGGFTTGKRLGYSDASDRSRRLPNGSVPCKTGPWGDIEYTPFTIAAPDDMLPVRMIEQNGTRWFMGGFNADSFVTFLQSTSLKPEVQQQFLDPAVFHPAAGGILLTPAPDLVFALPTDARAKFYQILAQSPENDDQINYVPKDGLADQFAGSGVSTGTVALFKKLCIQRGDYLMFSGVPAILAHISTYDEKLHFAKALTRQRTMLLNLHITPATDVEALTKYWDRGCWGTDMHTIFKSLTAIQTGTWMNIMMILPNLPAAEIYDYPNVLDNPLDGPPVNRDCAWTSFNFFRDVPDPNFGKLQYVRQELNDNYYLLKEAPRYGDLVLIARPDGFVIHAAIYMADDIWFTKNGSNLDHPWMLATESDVLKQFEFQINPDQQLTIKYFRNKSL
jgi:hypothetical protein